MCDNEFLGDVQRNLAYWRAQIGALDDERIRQLSPRYTSFLWAVDLGIRCRQTRVQAAELILVAFLWIERERHEQDWLPLMQRLLHIDEIDRQPGLYIQLLIQFGILLRLAARLEDAVTIHQKAIAQLESEDDPLTAALAHFHLSENFRRLNQIQLAMRHATQAQQQITRRQDEILYANILNTLGILHSDAGEFQQAAIIYQQALAIERQLDQPTRLVRILNNIARNAERQGQYDFALLYYEENQKILKSINNPIDRVTTYVNQGAIYFAQENWGAAETAFQFAKSLLIQNRGWKYYQALVETNLGKVAQARQQYEQAMVQFKRGEALWQQVGDEISLGNARGAIAEVYVEQGNNRAAQHYYSLAIDSLIPYTDHARARSLLTEFTLAKQELDQVNHY